MSAFLLKFWLRMSPIRAAWLAAHVTGQPDPQATYEHLVAICQRESRCTAIGAHAGDAHLSGGGYRGQVRLGHLDPSCQHNVPKGRWASRGAWGLSAASHWPYLPDCYQPEWLDRPLVSALVAATKWRQECQDARGRLLDDRPGWCRGRRAGRRVRRPDASGGV